MKPYALKHSTSEPPTRNRFVPALTALVVLGAYVVTRSREVGPGDAAELALQAHLLGVTHPPGYPLHTLLGKLASLAVGDPAAGTILLSAACSAVAVGVLCFINMTLTNSVGAGVLASLLFAFAPTVWRSAVVTEVYNVNVCFVGLALLLGLHSARTRALGWLVASGVVMGLSLGSGPANVLLLPGFLCLAWQDHHQRFRRLLYWVCIVGAVGAVVLSWSYVRAQSVVALGTTSAPDTLEGFQRFIQGAQYMPSGRPPLRFYVGRLAEHGRYWAASFLWVGAVFGVIGFRGLWHRQRRVALALLLMFIGNAGYFTWHPWHDYKDMTAPSCFVFAVWVACGARAFEQSPVFFSTRMTRAALYAALAGGAFYSGIREHWRNRQERPVTSFVRSSFEMLPPDAVVVTQWYRFTPLLYFQKVEGLRPDLRIIERAEEPRRYEWGTVVDWRTFAYNAAANRPVVLDVMDPAIARSAPLRTLGGGWYLVDRSALTSRSSAAFTDSRICEIRGQNRSGRVED